MFPNLRAEMARRRITMRELCKELNERGIKIALSTLSQKINGKYEFTLEEADAIQAVLQTDIPLDILFEREGA